MCAAEQRVAGAMSPARSGQAHVWHPRGELSPCTLPTPFYFLLCVFHINSFRQRAKLRWEAACFVISLWGVMPAQSSVLGHATASFSMIHPASSQHRSHGLSEETSEPPENLSWYHRAHWDARDLLPFQNVSSCLRSASKSLWSVGTQSTLNETLFHFTLVFYLGQSRIKLLKTFIGL